MIRKEERQMKNKSDTLDVQEDQIKEVIGEIKKEFGKTAEYLENNTDIQLTIAKELKEGLGNKDFDVNVEELKALKEEITGLKAEIKRLHEVKEISLSSLIIQDIKSIGNALSKFQEKSIGSLKHLYDNMKNQLNYRLTKAQEKLVQVKIGIVKGLVNSMQGFMKRQQQKLDACLEKLDNLSKEIQKDEENRNKESKKEAREETQSESDKPKREKKKDIQQLKKEKDSNKEKKPSVLKTLKENQKKVKAMDKDTLGKMPTKKDKGMEIG